MSMNTLVYVSTPLKENHAFTNALFQAFECLKTERVFYETKELKAWKLSSQHLHFLVIDAPECLFVITQREDNWTEALRNMKNGHTRSVYYDYVVCSFFNKTITDYTKIMDLLSVFELFCRSEGHTKRVVIQKGEVQSINVMLSWISELVQALQLKAYFPVGNIEAEMLNLSGQAVKNIRGDKHFSEYLRAFFALIDKNIAFKDNDAQIWRKNDCIFFKERHYTYVIYQTGQESWDVATIGKTSIVPTVHEMQALFEAGMVNVVQDLSMRIENGVISYLSDSVENMDIDFQAMFNMIQDFEPRMEVSLPQSHEKRGAIFQQRLKQNLNQS